MVELVAAGTEVNSSASIEMVVASLSILPVVARAAIDGVAATAAVKQVVAEVANEDDLVDAAAHAAPTDTGRGPGKASAASLQVSRASALEDAALAREILMAPGMRVNLTALAGGEGLRGDELLRVCMMLAEANLGTLSRCAQVGVWEDGSC